MGQTTPGTSAGARCPRCSAAVRPGAPWCTQCYAPTGEAAPSALPRQRAVPAAALADAPAAAPAGPSAAAPPAPSERPPAPTAHPTGTWPCSTCTQANDLALAVCEGCGTPFLAAVRATPPSIVLPVVGDLLALSPARRTGLAVGVVLVLVLAGALVALLLA